MSDKAKEYPIFHYDLIQGTDEWRKLRAGRITASVVKTFLVKGKGESGFGAGAITEIYKVLEEKLTGIPRESFKTKATDWGKLYESEAIIHYEMINFQKVRQIGFIERNEWTGASPDALVTENKGLEIKCFPAMHMQIISTGIHGKDEHIQSQFNLWVSQYESWDLAYYHPNMPEKQKMKIFTFTPDKLLFDQFEEREKAFIEIIEEKLEALKK